jgi:3-oxoacyl-[acyl-carrier-protein] synthase II
VVAFQPLSSSTFFSSLRSLSSSTTTQLSATKDDSQRVVVTGLGVISGCGIGADDFYANICAGKSSIRTVTRFDASNYPCKIASEVPDELFKVEDWFVNPKNARSNDRYTHLAVAAARQALRDAGIGDTPDTLSNPKRVGVMVGTAFGGVEVFEQETLKLAKKPEKPKVRPKAIEAATKRNCTLSQTNRNKKSCTDPHSMHRSLRLQFQPCLETQHPV